MTTAQLIGALKNAQLFFAISGVICAVLLVVFDHFAMTEKQNMVTVATFVLVVEFSTAAICVSFFLGAIAK